MGKVLDIKYFPLDSGKFIYCFAIAFIYRHKKYSINGGKYQGLPKGGCIIVSNHICKIDPFIIGSGFISRRMHFLAAEAVMNKKFVSILLKGMGCIKIDRSISDIEAIKKSVSVLKNDKVLTMFPQGGVKADDNIDEVKSGAALIALQANVPIIPVYTNKKKTLQRQVLVIGEPFYCKDYCEKKIPSVKDLANISTMLTKKMQECKKRYEEIVK